MQTRFAIGDFSRATQLSVKTLRHYHDISLLEPSEIDPDSGYRYYSDEQLPIAQVIRRLRGLQMPLPDIKAFLASPDGEGRNRLIVAHLERLESDLAQTQAAVTGLHRLLEEPQRPRQVSHRTLPATTAIAIEQAIDYAQIVSWCQGALAELQAAAHAQGLRTTGPAGGIYATELFEQGRGPVTIFIPVADQADAIGRVSFRQIPAAELAVALHRGSLADVDLTYGQLATHAAVHEIGIDGPIRELYLTGYLDTTDQDQWRTEIGWPIFRSDTDAGTASESVRTSGNHHPSDATAR
jgi:DNA-binding transcriptional MerR regulator